MLPMLRSQFGWGEDEKDDKDEKEDKGEGLYKNALSKGAF